MIKWTDPKLYGGCKEQLGGEEGVKVNRQGKGRRYGEGGGEKWEYAGKNV